MDRRGQTLFLLVLSYALIYIGAMDIIKYYFGVSGAMLVANAFGFVGGVVIATVAHRLRF